MHWAKGLGGSTSPSPELLAALPAIPRAAGARACAQRPCSRTCVRSTGTNTHTQQGTFSGPQTYRALLPPPAASSKGGRRPRTACRSRRASRPAARPSRSLRARALAGAFSARDVEREQVAPPGGPRPIAAFSNFRINRCHSVSPHSCDGNLINSAI